jgi:hypothetical protein
MGTITRSFANNITTSGVLLPASLTNASIANVTAYNASVATGGMVLLSTQTASDSASISFTTGIDSTYKEYQFYFIRCSTLEQMVQILYSMVQQIVVQIIIQLKLLLVLMPTMMKVMLFKEMHMLLLLTKHKAQHFWHCQMMLVMVLMNQLLVL